MTLHSVELFFVVCAYAAHRARRPASSAGSGSLLSANCARPRITSAALTSACRANPHATHPKRLLRRRKPGFHADHGANGTLCLFANQRCQSTKARIEQRSIQATLGGDVAPGRSHAALVNALHITKHLTTECHLVGTPSVKRPPFVLIPAPLRFAAPTAPNYR